MAKALQKDWNFSYTIEQLTLLLDIFLLDYDDTVKDESYQTIRSDMQIGSFQFLQWLSEEDRTLLLK